MSNKDDKAASPPPAGKTLAMLHGGGTIKAIVPTTLGECFALSEMVFKTGLSIPRDVDTPQKLTMILMKGMEIGLPPMASMECLGIINGKVCLYGDGIPSLLWSHGFKIREWYENEDDLNNIVAHCEVTRPEGDKYTFKYSAQDARDNGLWDTREKDSKGNPNKAPWFRFKKRMTRMRCRGWLARDCAADVLKGIPIYEEQADMKDITPQKQGVLDVPDAIDDGTATVTAPSTDTVSEAEANQDAPFPDPAKYLSHLHDELAAVRDKEIYEEIWAAHLDGSDGRLSQAHQDEAKALYEKYSARF